MPVSAVIEQIGKPFLAPEAEAMPPLTATPVWLAGLWVAGFAVVIAGWRRIRRAVPAASPLPVHAPVKVMSSPTLLEPGVFGVFRPVLLLPEGIADHLAPEQLRAILAHELCHIRRRDNLAGAIHMLVEAVFWFHPLVWWIGERLAAEREQACDEEVLRLGNEPYAYAEGILSVCKFYLESPLPCASGVTGADLKKRIDAILSDRVSIRLTPARKLLLAAAAAVAIAGPVFFGVVHAQAPAFEVASIKPAAPDTRGVIMQFTPGGGVRIVNGALDRIILMAYDAQPFQLAGGPSWITSARFDIVGKPPADAGTGDQQAVARRRLQALLAERFHLAIRRDSKEVAGFALTVARNGHKLKESDQGFHGLSGRPGHLTAEKVETADLAWYLAGVLGRPVADRTGLTRTYAFKLEWTPEGANTQADLDKAASVGVRLPDGSAPSIFTALQEQLGLRLESQKASTEVIVIDRVERPAAN